MQQQVIRASCAFLLALSVAPGIMGGAAAVDSAGMAKQLTTILDAQEATAFAAEHPGMPGRFVATLYYPGSQILTISAVYSAPDLLRRQIRDGAHRQVYVDLSTSAEQAGRLFVEDLGAPGLRQEREENGPFDITLRDRTQRTLYDGNWKAQQLSADEYRKRFAADDAEYTEMLRVLLAAARTPAAGSGAVE
jgi:hypothetical protein